ncbi:hypothetical protein FG386_002085 [Cryptosporidium ryanae]|uniref:uncharacterized protein n=1 Tax=Cryptosporidium ryanae TaxID=515981 RepID=UPI00351A856A|nr:hypothetical protein FG386_002085 [Cryptosporidium ryanae]
MTFSAAAWLFLYLIWIGEGYQIHDSKMEANFSEQDLLAALCWTLPFKFIKCDIEFEQNVLNHLRLEPIPRHKVSTTDVISYNIRLEQQTNGFTTSAVMTIREVYGIIVSNQVGNPVNPIPHQLKSKATAVFGVSHKAKNIKPSVNCVLTYSKESNLYYISPGRSEHRSISRSIPENITLKSIMEKTKTREMFYITLLSNQQFPIKPTASYGVGTEFLIPPVVCFGTDELQNQQYHDRKSYLGGALIYQRVTGPNLRDIIKFFKSNAMMNWLSSSASSEFDYKSRVYLRLEAQYALAHSVLAAILTLQHHSIAGRILHCDLNTKSIHIDRLLWSWSPKKIEENLNALSQMSPGNVKFTNFGYLRSTLETDVETLKCHQTENDLLRVKQFIRSIFSEQSTRTNFPESGSISSGMLSISTGLKMWWSDLSNKVSEPSKESLDSQELLEVEAILRVVNSDPNVSDSLERNSNFNGIVMGIITIHSAISKAFKRLTDRGYTRGRKRNLVAWSIKDLEPEPVPSVNKNVRKILSGKDILDLDSNPDESGYTSVSQDLEVELSAESFGLN